MIGYLKGTIAKIHHLGGRSFLWLEVASLGYEIQILGRWGRRLEVLIIEQNDRQEYQIFTHLQIREDQWLLFGFESLPERDLFRELINVSGIGTQTAMALMDGLELPTLIQAIVTGNIRVLCQAPGIGKKTAERLALELKTKLIGWREMSALASGLTLDPGVLPISSIQEEVEMTLLALGYSEIEITQALTAVGIQTTLAKTGNIEDWIRETIAWLSGTATESTESQKV